jgi:ecdysone receptor
MKTSDIHESDGEGHFKYITEMTILTVKLTVDFSKRLPGFDSLLREDQITLLKACSSEVMMLRCARRYDANTDSIVFANNLPYTRESYNMAGVGDTADPLFRFGKSKSQMKVDNAEYALLTAIVIFSGEFFFFPLFSLLCLNLIFKCIQIVQIVNFDVEK